MTLTNEVLTKLTTPKAGPITSRLPAKFAKTNAALIRDVKKAAAERQVQRHLDMIAGRV